MAQGVDIVSSFIGPWGNAHSFAAPASNGLLGWWWLGKSFERSVVNWAGGKDGIVTGDAAVSDYYLSFKSGSKFLDTMLSELDDMTFMVVARSTDDNDHDDRRPTFIGTSTAGLNTSEANIHVITATGARIGLGLNNGGITFEVSQAVVDDVTDWKCYIADFGTASRQINDMTTPDDSPIGTNTGTRAKSANTIAIGGGIGARRKGNCDIMAAGVWNRRISVSERMQVHLVCKAVAAQAGITI